MEVLKEVVLASGKKLTIYKGKGKHLFQAQMKANSAQEILWALIAELCEIDGKKIVMEDLFEMDLGEVFQIQSAFAEAYGGFFSLPQSQSSSFLNTLAGGGETSEK